MPSLTHSSAQEMARSCPPLAANLEERGEIVCEMGRVTYGKPLIFQYIWVQTAKVQVLSMAVWWKFPVKDYGIGPTTKVGVPYVNGVTFFLR